MGTRVEGEFLPATPTSTALYGQTSVRSPVSASSRVVGRQAELHALDNFLSRLSDGLACVALEGEAGVGKTTIWREVLQRARERDMLVLACRPSQVETGLSFAALGDLLDKVGANVLAQLPNPQRHALEVALLRVEDDAQPPDQRAIGVSVLSMLRHIAASSAVLLAVDDAQWLDAPTAGVLEFVARRLDAEPIGLLAACG
jgi:Cdc6-like AAA superfamily ATPase